MRDDRTRWDARFAKYEQPTDPAGEAELVAMLPLPEGSGLALDVACGRGPNALFLAEQGYDVVALDISINGLRGCLQSARLLNLSVYPVVMDLDCLALPAAKFRLVSVVRYLNRSLFETLARSVAPGGFIFYKTFNRRFLEESPGFNPDYLLEDGELAQAFPAMETVILDESGTSSYLLARAKGRS